MLQRAIKYKSEIENFFNDLKNENYLKYYWHSSRCHTGELTISGDEWSDIHRVSLSEDGKIVYGYFKANTDRENGTVDNISMLNMTKVPNSAFTRDTFLFIKGLLHKYPFRKISFKVTIGNPAEKQYDKIIDNLGGRIVGIQKKDVKLLDGKYYDVKLYEIMRDDYQGVE